MLDPLVNAWRKAPKPARYAAMAVVAVLVLGAVLRAAGVPV